MIRSYFAASCDHCGREFGPKRFDGVRITHWSNERELIYALGRDGWGILCGDNGDMSVMCSDCRQGGDS